METGTPIVCARAEVPPNAWMIADTVMPESVSENRKATQALFAECVIYLWRDCGQTVNMLDTAALLARIDARGISNSDVARALRVSPSRITELRKGERALKLDEAVKLVEAFGLEPAQQAAPLPLAVVRLLVRYIAERLGAQMENDQLAELTADIRAFAAFVADPKVRENLTAAETFFQAMRLRRPASLEEAPPENDPGHAH